MENEGRFPFNPEPYVYQSIDVRCKIPVLMPVRHLQCNFPAYLSAQCVLADVLREQSQKSVKLEVWSVS